MAHFIRRIGGTVLICFVMLAACGRGGEQISELRISGSQDVRLVLREYAKIMPLMRLPEMRSQNFAIALVTYQPSAERQKLGTLKIIGNEASVALPLSAENWAILCRTAGQCLKWAHSAEFIDPDGPAQGPPKKQKQKRQRQWAEPQPEEPEL